MNDIILLLDSLIFLGLKNSGYLLYWLNASGICNLSAVTFFCRCKMNDAFVLITMEVGI